MEYRKDIQILRGTAVILVVMFHLGLAGFHSGFLGVDVFFVISGYLMAVLYNHENKLEFFKRRSLRLLPAYFVTIILTLIVSIFIVKPSEYSPVFSQSLYADVFLSNIGYWMQNSYFSKIDFNPLLHLWSLAVEIQYYLIIPILFFFIRKSQIFLILIFLVSLSLCFNLVSISPKTSFFMMPLRIWEFLIGYGVARYFTINGNIVSSSLLRRLLGTLFLIVIFAIPYLKVEEESLNILTGHPGLYALLITLSTGAVIAFGIHKHLENSIFGDFFEMLGKYSYSIYLVHFPIIVLYLYKPFSGTSLETDNVYDLLILIAMIVVASIAMHYFVENKLRKFKHIKTILYAFPIIIVLVAFGGSKLQSYLFSDDEILIFNAFSDRSTYRCGKISRILNPSSISCEIADSQTNKKYQHNILFVGDSHADAIKNTFARIANEMDAGLYFMVPNNSLMIDSDLSVTRIVEEAKTNNASSIVLHYSLGAISGLTIQQLVNQAKKNHINVSFIMPVPTWNGHSVSLALWEYKKYNKPMQKQTRKDYSKRVNSLKNQLIGLDDLSIYEVVNYFCNDECAKVDSIGKPLYFDASHLTLTGSNRLQELFKKIVKESKSNI